MFGKHWGWPAAPPRAGLRTSSVMDFGVAEIDGERSESRCRPRITGYVHAAAPINLDGTRTEFGICCWPNGGSHRIGRVFHLMLLAPSSVPPFREGRVDIARHSACEGTLSPNTRHNSAMDIVPVGHGHFSEGGALPSGAMVLPVFGLLHWATRTRHTHTAYLHLVRCRIRAEGAYGHPL